MKKAGENKWVLEVQEDPETGDCILEFPPELLKTAGWKEGDTLVWEEMDNGAWSLSKKVVNVST
jgi:hypothetical protein